VWDEPAGRSAPRPVARSPEPELLSLPGKSLSEPLSLLSLPGESLSGPAESG
jgi:hypothetical protein